MVKNLGHLKDKEINVSDGIKDWGFKKTHRIVKVTSIIAHIFIKRHIMVIYYPNLTSHF